MDTVDGGRMGSGRGLGEKSESRGGEAVKGGIHGCTPAAGLSNGSSRVQSAARSAPRQCAAPSYTSSQARGGAAALHALACMPAVPEGRSGGNALGQGGRAAEPAQGLLTKRG